MFVSCLKNDAWECNTKCFQTITQHWCNLNMWNYHILVYMVYMVITIYHIFSLSEINHKCHGELNKMSWWYMLFMFVGASGYTRAKKKDIHISTNIFIIHIISIYNSYLNCNQLWVPFFLDSLVFVQWNSACLHALIKHTQYSLILLSLETHLSWDNSGCYPNFSFAWALVRVVNRPYYVSQPKFH